jgi:hypothetical protein
VGCLIQDIFLIMNKLLMACVFFSISIGGSAYGSDISKLVRLLESAPDWTTFNNRNDLGGTLAEQSILIYEKISREYDLGASRKAVETIVAKGIASNDPTQMNKLFIFNRIYFKINAGQKILHGGYSRGWTLDCDGMLDMLAPLGIDYQGKFYFKCRALVVMGPPYEPLKEFDFFSEKFGLRYNAIGKRQE